MVVKSQLQIFGVVQERLHMHAQLFGELKALLDANEVVQQPQTISFGGAYAAIPDITC